MLKYVKFTGRHSLHSGHGGIAKSENTQSVSYGSIYNATANEIKEKLVEQRIPTKVGIKSVTDSTKIGDIKFGNETENNRYNPVNTTHNNIRLSGNDIRVSFETTKQYRDSENARLHADNLKPFEMNPLIQPLNSSTTMVA